MQIGYHASHEQFSPSELLKYVIHAEQAGFQAVLSSDHIHPWSESQGQSGFAWSWLGAALQSTRIPFGIVTVPGYRYHPAILAQAVATLEEMFSDRFFLTMGSGENLNEHIIGTKWPVKETRNAILKESASIMQQLWSGKEVTQSGFVNIEETKLFVRAKKMPRIYGAALTEQTARWLGSWADGLITVSRQLPKLRSIIHAFREGGGKGKPIILKAQLSYDSSYEAALQGAYEQWRYPLLESTLLSDLKTTGQCNAAGEHVSIEKVKEEVFISSSPEDYINWINQLAGLKIEKFILHNVNLKQEKFINDFGAYVLPGVNK